MLFPANLLTSTQKTKSHHHYAAGVTYLTFPVQVCFQACWFSQFLFRFQLKEEHLTPATVNSNLWPWSMKLISTGPRWTTMQLSRFKGHLSQQLPSRHASRQNHSRLTALCGHSVVDSKSLGVLFSGTVVAVVEYIYKPYVFNHSVATSSAECNRCSPIQLGLWTAVDNMWHRLAFATGAHVGCCKTLLLSTGCAVALVGLEVIPECPVLSG